MTLSLPAATPGARSLTGVVPQLVAALSGASDWFAPARSAIVFTVDGLGAHNLAARLGHARFLAAHRTKKDVARTVFPSTTAAALTSLLTGADPGEHGIVGYRTRVPGTDAVVNQLKGWDDGSIDPDTWQRAEPLMSREAARGRPCFVVTRPEFGASGFTRATTRGARMHTAAGVGERAQLAADLAARHPGSLVYVYTPDLDGAGHKHGWQSEQWSTALEDVDAAVRELSRSLPNGVGAVVTADHGMVDVPRHRHVLLGEADPLLDGVRLIGGEPRMLHLYAEDGFAARVHTAWSAAESTRSWVLSRDEAIEAGLFGRVDAAVRPRIGDVVVAARGAVVYYDDRPADKAGQKMIGQHGSLSPEETTVPLIRLGAFA
ncbi:alkaline phosphatase family protein [Microbacterium protaetiae]|uniref:Alkaline phosphatase family protein n=1 Tax=Microbacterium protaetiae TaxID=2509458 RepID=A0A4P6ETD5_9MICO|nr:nucleotide pyrophosphatase/phosphodiesterase family protein [Microbacterium protaetiae]QAY61308.1 alkaline phosphatase family protein [Microbacterium protaetiae]